MSRASLTTAIDRISAAEPSSPIAVFISDKPGTVNCVFGATIESQRLIKIGDDLIGVYDKTMPLNQVRGEISAHTKFIPMEAESAGKDLT